MTFSDLCIRSDYFKTSNRSSNSEWGLNPHFTSIGIDEHFLRYVTKLLADN